jgi:uroporphyrin-III C-methyltransferase/precorrin-2 dehydrogenase/sirohydrochlorin ferrochelatase
LLDHGKPSATPIAIVSKGTAADQRVLTGTLEDIVDKQVDAKLEAPALIIVGEVVDLHEQLAWFGQQEQGNVTHALGMLKTAAEK